MLSAPSAIAAVPRVAAGSGRSYLSVSWTSAPGWPVPITTMLSAGWNERSPGTTASSDRGEPIRPRCCGVLVSGGFAAGPDPRGLAGCRCAAEADCLGWAAVEGLCVMETACGEEDAKMNTVDGSVDKGA